MYRIHIVQEIINSEPCIPVLFTRRAAAVRYFGRLARENGFDVEKGEKIDDNYGLSTDGYEVHIWFAVKEIYT